jgi:hypothetical protein
MALTSAGGGGKTIVKSATSGTLYTVPEGKTFKGIMWNNSSNGPGGVNGQVFYWPYNSSYFAHRPFEINLNGGDTVIAQSGGTTQLLGVES